MRLTIDQLEENKRYKIYNDAVSFPFNGEIRILRDGSMWDDYGNLMAKNTWFNIYKDCYFIQAEDY